MTRISRVNPPALVHVHVPKCAGTSFCNLLDDVFGDGHLRLYTDPETKRNLETTFVYTDSAVNRLVESTSIKALSSHSIRHFRPVISERPIYYVTFLRDPLQQFISYLSYTRRVYEEIHDPILLSQLPPNMPALSLRECAQWLMAQDTKKLINFRDNYTTNFFVQQKLESSYGITYSSHFYRLMRLYMAKKVLKAFFFVGICEHMEESWRLLNHKLKNAGFLLPSVSMPYVNNSGRENEDLAWLAEGDKVGKKVLASVRVDRRLYRWACRRLSSEAAFDLRLSAEQTQSATPG